MKKTSVAHLTSVHPRYDTRIFLKECRSLARANYNVNLVVADGKNNEIKDGVSIWDVGAPAGRIGRILNTTKEIYRVALSLDADIYHLHDPELMPIGLKLKRLGKKVVFDSHEDVPKQILSKPYLIGPVRRIVSKIFSYFEVWACKKFDSIVTATPFIEEKFSHINQNVVAVNNFPMIDELVNDSILWSTKKDDVCYVGGISHVRGIREMILAMEHLDSSARLQLGGKFSEEDLAREVVGYGGWKKVDHLGWLDRNQIRDVLNQSVAGLVTLHPIINYVDALPVKMFEYMSAGLPVIASNFPLWQEIIEGNDCGICVDPLNPREIAKAIDFIIDNPDAAEKMGRNGRRAVVERYNWGVEERKLFTLYDQLAS